MNLLALLFFTVLLLAPNLRQQSQVGDKIYKESEVTEKAVILARPKPWMPQQMYYGKCRFGRGSPKLLGVKLKVALLKSGEVGEVEVLKGRPCGTTESSIEAARRIKFKPALKSGNPVSQYVILTYNFIG